MRHLPIILLVGLIGAASLGFYTRSALPQEPGGLSAHYDSVLKNNRSPMVTDTGYFQLVGDSSASEYDTYKYRFPRKALYDFQAYYGLYGIPIDDLYKAWLKYGGYIGSPLGRSNEDLYNTCLLHARYTYECQNGGQR